MIDINEARRIAIANLGGPDYAEHVLIEEYDDGFVAREKPDDQVDEEGFPLLVGQGCIVIDRADGKITHASYVGPQTIEVWRSMRAKGQI